MIKGSHTNWSRSENLLMTQVPEARNSSVWQETTKNHLMLLKHKVQSSKWQRNAGEVDKGKIVNAFVLF